MKRINLTRIPKKILIIKPSSLGDIIHSLPFLGIMRDAFPTAQFHWIIARGLEGLLENHPMVDKLWVINKDHWKNLRRIGDTLSEFSSLSDELREQAYDLVIDLQGLLRSGALALASRAPVRVGFKEAREGSRLFYTHTVEGGKNLHAVDRYLKIAQALGAHGGEISFPMPLIKESERVKHLKEEINAYAVVVPGARWKTKQWHPERFGALASLLDVKSILVGSASDAETGRIIEAQSGGKAVSMTGKTDMGELISIIRGARFVVSNDSGPMHVAAALGKPVIALFGPTNPLRTGPYGSNHVIVRSSVSCAPCYRKTCDDLRCMMDISVDMVYEAIKESLPVA